MFSAVKLNSSDEVLKYPSLKGQIMPIEVLKEIELHVVGDKRPDSDVKFSLFDGQKVFDVFLDDEGVALNSGG
jgi:hypothetical protein